MKPNAPCHNCPDRELGCHATCEKYISYKKELDEINAKIKKEALLYGYVHEYEKRRTARVKNKRIKDK